MNNEQKEDKMLHLQNKWEKDTKHKYTMNEWQTLLQNSQTILTNSLLHTD